MSSRCLIRSLTQVRNKKLQGWGMHIKEQESYLQAVTQPSPEEEDCAGTAEAAAAQLDLLLVRLGRNQPTIQLDQKNALSENKPLRVVYNMLSTSSSETAANLFIIPATDMLYLSFLDFTEAVLYCSRKGLFLESDMNTFRHNAKQSTLSRVEEFQMNPNLTCLYFCNEHCENVSVLPEAGQCEERRCAMATAKTVLWLQSLLDNIAQCLNHEADAKFGPAKLVLMTENSNLKAIADSMGVRHCCSCSGILEMLSPLLGSSKEMDRLQNLAEELVTAKRRRMALTEEQFGRNVSNRGQNDAAMKPSTAAIPWWKVINSHTHPNLKGEEGRPLEDHSEYYNSVTVQEGLSEGILFRGTLDHSAHIFNEGWVNLDAGVVLDAKTGVRAMKGGERSCSRPQSSQCHRVLIKGSGSMNRALHGDTVVVRLLPRKLWSIPESDKRLTQPNTSLEGPNSRTSLIFNSDSAISRKSNDDDENSSRTSNIRSTWIDEAVPSGRIVHIFKQGHRKFVATIQLESDDVEGLRLDRAIVRERSVLAVPMNRRIPKIRIRTRQLTALAGHRLVIGVDSWQVGSVYPDGHFVRNLGRAGDLSTEAAALLLEHHLEDHARPFSMLALAELPQLKDEKLGAQWTVPPEEVARRRDLRKLRRVVSIDPPGCMDIDDALSVYHLENGNLEIGVHIADVTAFVAQGSPLDDEALHRGTSVYLVDQRLDMLPALLSTNLCSLLSGVDRLAMSVLWEVQPFTEKNDGACYQSFKILPEKTWYGRTLIQSSYALSYGQAQNIIDGRRPGSGNPNEGEPLPPGTCGGDVDSSDEHWLRKDLTVLRNFSRWLLKGRKAGGAMSFDSTEVKFKLNKTTGEPAHVKSKLQLEVHSTIEEMMILANSTVAEKIIRTFPSASLLRRHAEPDLQKAGELYEILTNVGKDKKSAVVTSETFASNLHHAVARATNPNARMLIKSLAVRVMSEAKYFCTGEDLTESRLGMPGNSSTSNRHYGLGISLYTHFTSPIRRYADIIVHRLLSAAIDVSPAKSPPFSSQMLITVSKHLNKRNREAKFAGSDSRSLFLALHLCKHPEVVDAVVSGLRCNGFLAFVPKYGIRVPVRIIKEYDHGRFKPSVLSMRGTLVLASLKGESIDDPREFSVLTVSSGASEQRLKWIEIIGPLGDLWRKITLMDSVKVKLFSDPISVGDSFRAPKVKAVLVSHEKCGVDNKTDSSSTGKKDNVLQEEVTKNVPNSEKVSYILKSQPQESGPTLESTFSSSLYTTLNAVALKVKDRIIFSERVQSMKLEASAPKGCGSNLDCKFNVKHIKASRRGRRSFGGWTSMQPLRVGLGGANSSAPPLYAESTKSSASRSNSEQLATSQKRIKKLSLDATRRIHKVKTRKREAFRRK